MKFLFVDTYYRGFLDSFYRRQGEALGGLDYSGHLRRLLDECFGTSDYYSANLRSLDCEALDVVANDLALQARWAHEFAPVLLRDRPAAGTPQARAWAHRVLAAQIGHHRPDVVYIQDIHWADADFLDWLRPQVRLVVGQVASAIRASTRLDAYDLLLSSFPHFVQTFRSLGLQSEYLRIAFEPRVLARLAPGRPRAGAVFVGSYSADHARGTALLEQAARSCPLDFWGYGLENLAPDSPIRRTYKGEAWGLDMYQVLASAGIALNRHIRAAGRFANNMRLYESTGCGALLLTDARDNLAELFDPEREIAAYRTAGECLEKLAWYLGHPEEAGRIAAAGQARTLRDHTYAARMTELKSFAERRLRPSGQMLRPEPWPVVEGRLAWQARWRRLRERLARLPGAGRLRRIAAARPVKASAGYQPLDGAPTSDLTRGWLSPAIPAAQRELVDRQLRDLYLGRPTREFEAAADCLERTGLADPRILELGCASGYYAAVLSHLHGRALRYTGLDYSLPLLFQGRGLDARLRLVNADAARLPFGPGCADVAFSAGLLLHVPDWAGAVRETARVAAGWAIFHRTPVALEGATTAFSKRAYGVPVAEWIFAESELLACCRTAGLQLAYQCDIDSRAQAGVAGPVVTRSYLFRKLAGTA